MAGGQERILRRRIKTMQSTKKITRAMELIAATRIVKAQQRVQAARPYADQITAVVQSLAAGGAGAGLPLLTPRSEVRKVAYVVVAGDRGLCGGYNSSVIRLAERALVADRGNGKEYSLVLVGKKAEDYFRFRKYRIDDVFKGFSDSPGYENARQVASAVAARFEAGETDQVELFYTQFLSAGSQRAVQRRFMPMEISVAEGAGSGSGAGSGEPQASYEFEPEPNAILGSILPRYLESRMYAALLDASASEYANRQRAMKSATDNAGDLILNLSRQMNQARQTAITTEIMEIVGGAEALGASKVSAEFVPDRPTF